MHVRMAPKAPAAPTPEVESDRVAALERGLALLKEERSAAETKVTQLKKKVARVQKALDESEQRNKAPNPTIGSILADWGFESADERARKSALPAIPLIGDLARIEGFGQSPVGHEDLVVAAEHDIGQRPLCHSAPRRAHSGRQHP